MQSAPPSQAPWIRQKWAFLAGLARRMPRLFHCCTKIETSGAARRPTNQFPCISYQHANEQPITVRLHALSLAPWNLALECETGSAQTRTNQAPSCSLQPGLLAAFPIGPFGFWSFPRPAQKLWLGRLMVVRDKLGLCLVGEKFAKKLL